MNDRDDRAFGALPGSDSGVVEVVPPRWAMTTARLIDLGRARALIASQPGIGMSALGRALGIPVDVARGILGGRHWQQRPDRVAVFNAARGYSIPLNGEPSAADLVQFRAQELSRKAGAMAAGGRDPVKSRAVVLAEAAAARAASLARAKPPMRLDSAYFQGAVDEAIWRILRELDSVKVAGMNGRELAAAASALLEKRALLRGEPTAIIRSENRGSLEKVGELLLAELARRGRTIPGVEKLIEGRAKEVAS